MRGDPVSRHAQTDPMAVSLLVLGMLVMIGAVVIAYLVPVLRPKLGAIFVGLAVFGFLDGLWHLHIDPASESDWFGWLKFAFWLTYVASMGAILGRWMGS